MSENGSGSLALMRPFRLPRPQTRLSGSPISAKTSSLFSFLIYDSCEVWLSWKI